MPTLEIPAEYGYVLLAAASTFVLNTVHMINTVRYRKAAKVEYPATYAPSSNTSIEAYQFNCAQRAHVNFLENQPTTVASLLIAGTSFPITSAVLGLGWSASRYMYMVGYSTGEKGGKGRGKKGGLWFFLFQFGLMGMAIYSGVAMVLSK